jgi:hypothetical protein
MSTCPICETANIKSSDGLQTDNNASTEERAEFYWYKCTKCGDFKISYNAKENMLGNIDLQKISSWISEKNKVFGENPFLDSETIETILNQRDRRIQEKFDCFMKYIAGLPNKKEMLAEDMNHCYVYNESELEKLILKAEKEGFIQKSTRPSIIATANSSSSYQREQGYKFTGLTFEGQEYVENLDLPNKHSHNIFMAFWFDKDVQSVFDNTVKPAIDKAGFLAERVSSSTTELDGKISDEIIAKIKSSRAVIADCTGQRQAVYFEAGFAMGMRIPVIWTCRKSDVQDICFDANHYPFILWETPKELAEKIVNRLKREL